MRRTTAAVAALVLAATGLTVTTAAATESTTRTVCATTWGSLEKSAGNSIYPPLRSVRTGQHACYDRIVFDMDGNYEEPLNYTVQYVKQFRQEGSGTVIPVKGGAILEIRLAAPSYDPESGTPTYPGKVGKPLPGATVDGYRTFRDTRYGASVEGDTQAAVGVRARLPFRVLQFGDRLVVDVAHTWEH